MNARERIEKLVGSPHHHAISYPGYRELAEIKAINTTWLEWRESLIERLSGSAVVVYGNEHIGWDDNHLKLDDKSALLIDVQPLKRGVSKAEIVEHLRGNSTRGLDKELAARIEAEGIIE